MLHDLGKTFLLQLAPFLFHKVNHQRDVDGTRFARSAMIIIGIVLNTNSPWEVSQLTPKLQHIVENHHTVFNCLRATAMEA